MSESNYGNPGNEGPERGPVHHDPPPYWKRAHHDWRFWGGLFLMLVAIIIYVMSYDLAWRPRSQLQQPLSGAIGK